MFGLTTTRKAHRTTMRVAEATGELASQIRSHEERTKAEARKLPIEQYRDFVFSPELEFRASLTLGGALTQYELSLVSFELTHVFSGWIFYQNRAIRVTNDVYDWRFVARFVEVRNRPEHH